MAVRFGVSSTVDNRLPKYSNFWDGTAVYNPYTPSSSYDALATYTVPSGGVSSITFAGLPTGGQYTHLQIRGIAKDTRNDSAYGNPLCIRFNNDSTSSYSFHYLYGTSGGANGAGAGVNSSNIPVYTISTTTAASQIFGAVVVDILDYANTNKQKVIRSLGGMNANLGTNSESIFFCSGRWGSTNAVNTITIFSDGFNLKEYTQISIYGVRG